MSCTQSALDADRPSYRMPIVPAGAEVRLRATAWRYLAQTIASWLDRDRQRHDLADLDEHLLRDIGVTPTEAASEAAKPFWREEVKKVEPPCGSACCSGNAALILALADRRQLAQ